MKQQYPKMCIHIMLKAFDIFKFILFEDRTELHVLSSDSQQLTQNISDLAV